MFNPKLWLSIMKLISFLELLMKLSKFNTLIKQGLLGLLFFISTLSYAQQLPFIGTRTFNFDSGNNSGQVITIKKNGDVIIKSDTPVPYVIYKGKYRTFIPIYDDGYYKIVGNRIQWLDKRKKIKPECFRIELPESIGLCSVELYKD